MGEREGRGREREREDGNEMERLTGVSSLRSSLNPASETKTSRAGDFDPAVRLV